MLLNGDDARIETRSENRRSQVKYPKTKFDMNVNNDHESFFVTSVLL